MPCYHPIPASRETSVTDRIPGYGGPMPHTSVRLFPGRASQNLTIPCGRCIGCKTRRAQEWALRVMHETRDHESSLFATLTYDDDHLPADRQLVPRDLSLFLKRLRKAAALSATHIRGTRLRYVACGEYGDRTFRPHYHAILFGLAFEDQTRATAKLLTSPTLSNLWGKGTVNYGEVTRASAAYVAGYTTKSLGRTHCDADGVVMQAPFLRCSTRPGIGHNYATRYAADFRNGSCYLDGQHHAVPRYYQKLLGRHSPSIAEESQHAAYLDTQERLARDAERTPEERLAHGEIIAIAKQKANRTHSL